MIRTDLGIATAYAEAVSKGYTGTRDEFGQMFVDFGKTAEKVTEDKKSVEQMKASVEETKNSVDTTAAEFGQNVADKTEEAKAAITEHVNTEKASATDAIAAVKDSAAAEITKKGTDTLATIPDDYTALSKDVSSLKEDLGDLSRVEYVDILASPDVVSINSIGGFPYPEHSAEQIKTVEMSVIDKTSCELNIVFKAKAARKYLLSSIVCCISGNGKVMVANYGFTESHSIYQLFKDNVKWKDNLINNTSTTNQNVLIAIIGETSTDSNITARLRIESNDKTLIADYSQMSLVDITDIYNDIEALNKYINMSYNERFNLKPKGISAETKHELEANLIESKQYTDIKTEAEGNKSNYLYGKKWWAVGDSITYGARSDIDENGVRKTYATYIANRNGMNLELDAISGRAMGVKGDRTDSFCMNGYYNNCPFDYPDYITIFLGTNDTEEVGTIDSTDMNTFAGAYNKVLDYLTMTYPRAKIGIIPIYNLAESRGRITIALGEKWGVPVFNWDTHSFFYYHYQKNTVMERKQKEFMYFDGTKYEVHPNDVGYQFMSTMIESWMREL